MSAAKDGFFAVNKTSIHSACNLGMNAGIAYLVIASGSGSSNTVSNWSKNAIETYTGISRLRAKEAVELLVSQKIIKLVKGGTKPQYRLMDGRKTKTLESDKVIWLPNGIVQGVANEASPLERIRQTQDKMCLRLFVDMYSEQNLIEDGGISRNVTYIKYDKLKLGQQAQFNIYGFGSPGQYVVWSSTTLPHKRQPTEDDDSKGSDFFKRYSALADAGVVAWVPHLFDGAGKEAEIIHPLGHDTDLELRVTRAAREAAIGMITRPQLERAIDMDYCDYLCPIPRHAINAELIGIARLVYKPRTKMTNAWHTESTDRLKFVLSNYLQHQGDIKFKLS